jgi:dienelactone hydrolase
MANMSVTPKLKTYSTSKYQAVLAFPEAPPDAVYFEHPFDGYALEGRIVYNEQHDEPWILSIHGARADYSKSDAMTLGLRARGHSVLSMNLSGHSEAGVLPAEQTSLANNINEVATFFKYLDPRRPKTVIGYSMGGTSALKLLEKHGQEIDKLILCYPGIYDKRAYDVHFGPNFREIISQPFSYRNNDTISLLKKWPGKLLLVHGEFDGLDPESFGKPAGTAAGEVVIDGQNYYSPIPKEVLDMIYDAVPPNHRSRIIVPKCGHSIVLWMRENPQAATQLLQEMDHFLKAAPVSE